MLGENSENGTWICKLFWHSLENILWLDCTNSGVWWGVFLKWTKLLENSGSKFSGVVYVLLQPELFEHQFKCCKWLCFFLKRVIFLRSQNLCYKQWFKHITSLCISGKSSLSSKASVSGSKLSSSANRLALVRPTRVSSLQAADTEKSRERARSASTPKTSSAVSLAKFSASATSEAAGSGIQRLNSVPSLQKLCQQNKDGSATKGSLFPKPRARVLSVPTSQTKVPVKTGGKHRCCMTCLLAWLLNQMLPCMLVICFITLLSTSWKELVF